MPRVLGGCVVVSVLCVLAMMCSVGVDDVALLAGVSFLVAACALPVLMATSAGAIRFDHPSTIMALVVALYWVAGLVTHTTTIPGLACPRLDEFLWPTALAGIVALASFYLTAGLPTPDSPDYVAPEPEMTPWGVTAWIVALAVLWIARAIALRSGVYFTHAGTTADLQSLETSSWLQISNVLRLAPCVLSVALWRKHPRVALVIAATDGLYTLGSGARLFVLHIGIYTCLMASLYGRSIRIFTLVAAGGAFVLVVNPIVYRMRAANPGVDATPAEIFSGVLSTEDGSEGQLSESMLRTSASGYMADTMCLWDGEQAPLLGGETYWESIATTVPRILWPGKPSNDAADMVAAANRTLRLPNNDAIGNPIMEGWINFSYLGVAGAFALMGLVARELWNYRVRNAESPGRLGFYAMAMSAFFTFETHSTVGLFAIFRFAVGLMALDAGLRAIGAVPG